MWTLLLIAAWAASVWAAYRFGRYRVEVETAEQVMEGQVPEVCWGMERRLSDITTPLRNMHL